MPTYSYACKDCDNAFDLQQAFSDDALTVCPTCGGRLRKVYGSVGVVFKGSGFYRTDSRKGAVSAEAKTPAAAGASTSSAASTESGSSGASSSTTKPASSSTSTGSSKAAASA